MRVSITVYKNSGLATVVSLIGRIVLIIGIFCIVSIFEVKEITDKIAAAFSSFLLIGVGILLTLLADRIATKKQFKAWQEKVIANGFTKDIRENPLAAIQIYNTNPGKDALEWIESLNPQAGMLIRQMTAKKKETAAEQNKG